MKNLELLFVSVLVVFMIVSCSAHKEQIEEAIGNPLLLTRALDDTSDTNKDYTVSMSLLNKYLRLTKTEEQYQVTPLILANDTLAYCIQYDTGWDIISGDQRCAPVIIKSDGGECDINTDDIQGALAYLQQIRCSTSEDIMPVWAFLSNKQSSGYHNKNTRGGGSDDEYTRGMWRAIDTIYVDEFIQTPHIIRAQWSQSYPWNMFRPLLNGQSCPVGCPAMATGQILHHFRSLNSMEVQFPVAARAIEGITQYSVDSNSNIIMDSSRWSEMALQVTDKYNQNIDVSALMLAYLAQDVMDLTPGNDITQTSNVNVQGIRNAFFWGKLDYDEYSGYPFDNILYSLQHGSPVCVFTEMENPTRNGQHVYIIDRYQISDSYFAINCWWDPDYIVSREEFESYPYERFIERADDITEKVFTEARLTYTYWGMNWGYANTNYDNRFYISRIYSGETIEDSGIIDAVDYIFDPFWDTPIGMTGSIHNIFCNFKNFTN